MLYNLINVHDSTHLWLNLDYFDNCTDNYGDTSSDLWNKWIIKMELIVEHWSEVISCDCTKLYAACQVAVFSECVKKITCENDK